MKRTYEAPKVKELGSVSKLTKQMMGTYGEFTLPGQISTGMMMTMMA